MSTDVFFPYALAPSKLGRPTNFVYEEPDTLIEYQPNPYLRAQYAIADPYETIIDNCPQRSESSTNTEQVDVSSKGQAHSEGGWPTSVDASEPEERNKYARRLCRDERHVEVLKVLVPQLSTCLRANGALDIYEPLFEKTRFAMPAKDEAEAEVRSRRLCPWRHAGTDREELGTGEAVGSSETSNVNGGLPMVVDFAAASKPKPRSDEIAYSDPSVVHALHISCKLSIPVLDDGKPVHGTTASQSRFTCGSDSTTLVVGYCEGILPAKIDIAGTSVAGASGADMFGQTTRMGNSRLSAYESINNQLGVTGNFLGSPSGAGGRRSTAASPAYLSNQRKRSNSATPNGGDDEGQDLLGASLRNNTQSAAFIMREEEEEGHLEGNSNDFTTVPSISVSGGDGAPKNNASNTLLSDAKRATNNLKKQNSTLAALAGTYSLSPLRPAPMSEWGCAGAMWSITDPSAHTNLFMSCNGGATSIVASYRDPNVVHGGMSSGVLEWWDIRQGPNPVAASGRDHSHRDAVTCVKLVTTKATECFSCGLDGQVLFWDTRRLASPIFEETVQLKDPRTGAAYAATGIDFDPLVGGTLKYLVSTMEGKVISCGRRANKAGEKVLGVFDAHYGACFSAMRCPAVPKVFASCGDWGFKLFGDELKSSPIYTSPMVPSHVLCGTWHPTRHSIFILGTSSGDVYFYDVLRTAHASVMKIRASSCAIRHLEVHVSGQSIAATDINGEVHIITLPSALYEPTFNERQNVVAALEREYNRERVSDGIEASNPFVFSGNGSSATALVGPSWSGPVGSRSVGSPASGPRGTSSSSTWHDGKDLAATAEGASMFMGAINNADRPQQSITGGLTIQKPLLVTQATTKPSQKESTANELDATNDGEDEEGAININTNKSDEEYQSDSDFAATHNQGAYGSRRPSPSPGRKDTQSVLSPTQSAAAKEVGGPLAAGATLAEVYLAFVGVPVVTNPYAALPNSSSPAQPQSKTVVQQTEPLTSQRPDDRLLTAEAANNNNSKRDSHRGSGLFSRLQNAAALSKPTAVPNAAQEAPSTSSANAAEAHSRQRERRASSASGISNSFSINQRT